jgi:hypothetical protein
MSLSLALIESIDNVVDIFISKVSKEYNIDKDELKTLWSGEKEEKHVSFKNDSLLSSLTNPPLESGTLVKYTKAELIALCKKHGHKCSGTKTELIHRLLGNSDKSSDKPTKSKSTTSSTKSKSNTSSSTTSSVVNKLKSSIPDILVKRNQFNNFEHAETGLVFESGTKMVIGKQNNNGDIDPLTEEDIDNCNAFKFKYKLPTNLNTKSNMNVNVDELEEEDIKEEEIDVIEDEEEIDEEDLIEEEYEEVYTEEEYSD